MICEWHDVWQHHFVHFCTVFLVFHWTLNARAPNRGSTTAVASCRRKRRRLRFWEVSPKERCEWLWIGSYAIISTYNHGKLWWEPAYWPWIIEFQGNIPLLIDRWNNQRPWITFGWMEGNAKLDLLATGVICWVCYGYFITLPSCNPAYLHCLFAFEMCRINHQDVFSAQTLMYQIAD